MTVSLIFKTPGISQGISSTLLPSLCVCVTLTQLSHLSASPPWLCSSQPATITVWTLDKHRGQPEVTAFPLRSPGFWKVISCSMIMGPLFVNLTMPALTYCMCHTRIVLKIHSWGKAKTMSVSADARRWWKAGQWHFCLDFRRCGAVKSLKRRQVLLSLWHNRPTQAPSTLNTKKLHLIRQNIYCMVSQSYAKCQCCLRKVFK